ncbi:MAG: hypothetical protein ABI415_09435 [Flavitalea sp.]
MRKVFFLTAFVSVLVLGTISSAIAQKTHSADGTSYKNAVGLGIDFGDGLTMVGVTGKHFFTDNHVGVGEVLFGDHTAKIQAFYQFHSEIEAAPGLRWFAGVGPSLALYRRYSNFSIVPIGGLDYKIPGVPFNFSFDWRPNIVITHGGDFLPARFGLGFRYAFNDN